jgi:hypothetical protein
MTDITAHHGLFEGTKLHVDDTLVGFSTGS